jgi:hypothetical protein
MIDQRLCSPSRDGQELLPQLVAKLITVSIPKEAIREFRFPHGDQVYLHGEDGILAINDTVEHFCVPSGISVWEMGTSTDPKSKAEDDFSKAAKKLSNAFPNLTPPLTSDQVTFVFITSKPWESGEWVKNKRASSSWKSIKVLDAVALEKWIEQCPAVMLWFADVCGLPVEGLYDAEQYLRKLSIDFGVLAISPELAVAGRIKDMERLREPVLQGHTEIHIRGESVEEGAAFLAGASLMEADAYAKTTPLVFADSRANLNLLATFGTEMTLVPLDSDALARARRTTGQRCRLIIPEVNCSVLLNRGEMDLTLERCKRAAVEQLLVDQMELPEHKARQIARDTKGSFVALLWLLGASPVDVPRWASRKDATTHASLILAGCWLGANEPDTKVIERLSRKDYRDVETLLQSAEIPDGPWIHRGVEWMCVSKDFVWGQLVGKVTETMLLDFNNIVREVVGEKDPSLELPLSDRHMANLFGKTRKYSRSLRAGLVDSVARLALFKPDGQDWADRIVRDLLDPEHSDAASRWLSLADVYSEIAEAAPDVFLKCLDAMVQSGTATELFQDANSKSVVFAPTSAHVYLLWALERLAWQKDCLARVLSLLVKLAEIDPGTKTGNSPKNSIVTILLPWCPQHADTMKSASQLLNMLYSTSPSITWEVAVALLPTFHSATMPNPTPLYRSHSGKREVTTEEYWEFVRPAVEMMILWAGNDAGRWATMVTAYPAVWLRYQEAGQLITDALQRLDADKLTESDKAVVHSALRKLISYQREYPNTNWTLPDSVLALLESLEERFLPDDAVLKYCNLFSWEPDVPDAPMGQYENGWEDWLSAKRLEALKAVYDQDRLPGIYRLAETVTLPDYVGLALVRIELSGAEVADLLQTGLSIAPGDAGKYPLKAMASAYASWSFHEKGDKWLGDVLALPGMIWTAEAYANLALALPASPSLWRQIQEWGDETDKLYWKHIGIRDFSEHWPEVLDKWKAAHRPWSSLQLVARVVDVRHATSVSKKPSPEQVMDVLEQALRPGDSTELPHQQDSMISHSVELAFMFLDTQNANPTRLAQLEWGWFRVLEHTKRGAKILHGQVTSSPQLFVDLLKAAFRGEGEPKETDMDASEHRREMAEQAYRVLNGLHTVPGYHLAGDVGTVDSDALREWVAAVRRLAQEAGRLGVCDSQIGQVLSHAPPSPDGTWPCLEVRNVIEEIQSPVLESGLRIGKYNQRGVVWRGEGGKQEWGLAQKYQELAEKVRNGWPRTANLLDGLAKGYAEEARQWDEQAKRDEYE